MLFDRIDLRFGSNRKTTVPDPTLKISHVQIITKPDPDPELRSDLGYNSLVKLLPGGQRIRIQSDLDKKVKS